MQTGDLYGNEYLKWYRISNHKLWNGTPWRWCFYCITWFFFTRWTRNMALFWLHRCNNRLFSLVKKMQWQRKTRKKLTKFSTSTLTKSKESLRRIVDCNYKGNGHYFAVKQLKCRLYNDYIVGTFLHICICTANWELFSICASVCVGRCLFVCLCCCCKWRILETKAANALWVGLNRPVLFFFKLIHQ